MVSRAKLIDPALEQRLNRIAAKLLAVLRAERHPFGSHEHGFRFAPPLAEEQVAAFEKRYGIELPDDYRAFITRIANGGAGPAYGMYTLEEAHQKERRELVPDDFLRTPFLHAQAYDPNNDPEVAAFFARIDRGEIPALEEYRHDLYETAGTLALCHEGCGYLHLLIVTGPARGQMWLDGRCSDQGFFPLGVGFLDWYEKWLNSTLNGNSGVWWLDGPVTSGPA
jgi:hypothetical protein